MTFQEDVQTINEALAQGDVELARSTMRKLLTFMEANPEAAFDIPLEDRKAFVLTFHRPEWDADNPEAPWVFRPEGERLVPWEAFNQITPGELPEDTPDPDRFPLPWGTCSRGNGHEDVIANNGVKVAHVYCWSGEDQTDLDGRVKKLNKGYL